MTYYALGLLADTFIHSGTGRNEGAIDLPVAREAATDYPYLPGSGMKGALRDYSRDYWTNGDGKDNKSDLRTEQCFGVKGAENAGGVLVSDARLLLLPVRSLTGAYKWITCPLVLERLQRDLARSGLGIDIPNVTSPTKGEYLGANENSLYLEERTFQHNALLPDGLVEALTQFIANDKTAERLAHSLLVLHDNDFNWFARYALSVQARNVLDENKKSKNLWYEETLPPDTVMVALLGERVTDSGLTDLADLLREHPWLQTGGNETVGQGWFQIKVIGDSEDETRGEGGDEH